MTFTKKSYQDALKSFRPMKRSRITPKASLSRQSAPLRPIGKKGSEWVKARSWLKRQFRYRGLTYCMIGFSGCWFDDAIGFAHPAKRRNLKEGELYLAVPACNPCHDKLENLPPEEMRQRVEKAFASTGISLPKSTG